MNAEVRVRFAPSPTGALHIGGVRTALYNYLFARKHHGKIILRIEDTDQSRYVKGAEDYITNALQWLGLEVDEGPEQGGAYGPYRQSERRECYKKYVEKLLEEGKAYIAFDTPEELDAMRERLKAAKVHTPQYNAITRVQMKNSITLSEDEVQARIKAGEPYVIRLKVPRKEEIRLNDLVRGWVMVHSSSIDDKVLMKSDGMPTYHLANVVDDHLMKISHVIRGEEWLPSAPLHVLLYKFLGWEKEMPQFAHLPLLLKSDGNGKLSKRDAEKQGFPIFPLQWRDPETGEELAGFREAGYGPEALINFLALLGWNPGTEQEIFDLEDLIRSFSIERIGKSGIKFDINKAKWFNQHYLRTTPDDRLTEYLLAAARERGVDCNRNKAIEIVSALKERVTFPQDFWEMSKFAFVRPEHYDETLVRKKWKGEAITGLDIIRKNLSEVEDFTAESIKTAITKILDEAEIPLGKVMPGLRLALTGLGSGPDLMMIMQILGKNEAITRLTLALENIEIKQ